MSDASNRGAPGSATTGSGAIQGGASHSSTAIRSVLQETRIFPPPADFAARAGGALVPDMEAWRREHERSIRDPQGWWAEQARTLH